MNYSGRKYIKIILGLYLFFVGGQCLAQFQKIVDPITGHVTLVSFRSASDNAETRTTTRPTESVKIPEKSMEGKKKISQDSRKGFPVVSVAEQKSRDVDRYEILKDELDKEKKILALQLSKKSDQNVLSRIKENIASLEREIKQVQR